MGLDMYLNAKRYLWGDSQAGVVDKISQCFPELGEHRVKQITAEVGYWRKANHIHKWFVENVQDGNDDCNSYEVSEDQLKELLSLIDEVLADHDKADALLPTTSGFFFGNTDYDEFYFESLQYTKEMLTDLLDEKWKTWYFEYQSSW